MNNKAAVLSNWLRENAATLEKTEELLIDTNLKIKRTTAESSENNKVSEIRAAIGTLRRELLEMDQKREILSWQVRQHILGERGKGKDDYLEINYFEEV